MNMLPRLDIGKSDNEEIVVTSAHKVKLTSIQRKKKTLNQRIAYHIMKRNEHVTVLRALHMLKDASPPNSVEIDSLIAACGQKLSELDNRTKSAQSELCNMYDENKN